MLFKGIMIACASFHCSRLATVEDMELCTVHDLSVADSVGGGTESELEGEM